MLFLFGCQLFGCVSCCLVVSVRLLLFEVSAIVRLCQLLFGCVSAVALVVYAAAVVIMMVVDLETLLIFIIYYTC